MIVIIDERSALPPYVQLRDQIVAMAAAGTLVPGDRVPTVRQLAGDLGIAPGTVQRAYRELLDAGILEGRGRHGTFVAAAVTTRPAEEIDGRLRDAAEALVTLAQQLGRTEHDALAALRSVIAASTAPAGKVD